MGWMFIVDLVFYAVLGIMTFPLLVLFVKMLSGQKFDDAYASVKGFVTRWAELPGKDFVDKTLKVSGVSAMLFVLAFGAYVANRAGDWALPKTAAWLMYFGEERVRWSAQYPGETDDVVTVLRTITKIEHDRQKWEEAKAGFGRYDVRFFRVLTVYCALLVVAALFNLFRKPSRASAATLAGITLALLASHALWAEREEQYWANLMGRYLSTHVQEKGGLPTKPVHFPGKRWPQTTTVAAKVAPAGTTVKTSAKGSR